MCTEQSSYLYSLGLYFDTTSKGGLTGYGNMPLRAKFSIHSTKTFCPDMEAPQNKVKQGVTELLLSPVYDTITRNINTSEDFTTASLPTHCLRGVCICDIQLEVQWCQWRHFLSIKLIKSADCKIMYLNKNESSCIVNVFHSALSSREVFHILEALCHAMNVPENFKTYGKAEHNNFL